jgi:hypothetical protein
VAISGAGLQNATGVTMSGTGITCTLAGPPTGTSVSASCVISPTAFLTTRNVHVVTPDASGGRVTLDAAFTVTR